MDSPKNFDCNEAKGPFFSQYASKGSAFNSTPVREQPNVTSIETDLQYDSET